MNKIETYRCHKLRSCQRAGEARGEADAASKVKVTDLDRAQSISVHTQNVLGLQVPVRYALPMEEVEGVGELAHYLRRLRFREVMVLLDSGKELPAVDLQQGRMELVISGLRYRFGSFHDTTSRLKNREWRQEKNKPADLLVVALTQMKRWTQLAVIFDLRFQSDM